MLEEPRKLYQRKISWHWNSKELLDVPLIFRLFDTDQTLNLYIHVAVNRSWLAEVNSAPRKEEEVAVESLSDLFVDLIRNSIIPEF